MDICVTLCIYGAKDYYFFREENDNMAERPEDLNLPNAVVTRIVKDCLPDGVKVSKEANAAIAKVTKHRENIDLKQKRHRPPVCLSSTLPLVLMEWLPNRTGKSASFYCV